MKGVILAGGTGSRLGRLTTVLNKHLVAVGPVPMIEYPLATLRKMGINDVTIVTGAEHAGTIMSYLTKEHPEIDFTYKVQKEARGIAQALGLVENVVHKSKIAVILGDNIFDYSFYEAGIEFEESDLGAMLFLKKVPDPERFGVAEVERDRIGSIEEKPLHPKSNLAVTGIYFYDESVFDRIRTLRPSARGELEVTDLNNSYLFGGRCGYRIIRGFWSDAGTHESIRRATQYIEKKGLETFI